MKTLTKKERLILEQVLRPLIESDYFENSGSLPKGVKDKEEALELLNSAYKKIDVD
jgi:hypothetical protein